MPADVLRELAMRYPYVAATAGAASRDGESVSDKGCTLREVTSSNLRTGRVFVSQRNPDESSKDSSDRIRAHVKPVIVGLVNRVVMGMRGSGVLTEGRDIGDLPVPHLHPDAVAGVELVERY
jgi:hypothetical protein